MFYYQTKAATEGMSLLHIPPPPPALLSNLEAHVLKTVESEPWSRSHCSEESSLTKNIHIGL